MTVHPLDILLIQATQEGLCQAAAACAYVNGGSVFASEMGARPETLFDVASLTKVMATTVSYTHLTLPTNREV